MKLSIILLVATILQASASGYAQKITLSEKNAPLEKVLKKIGEQSGYDFFYNSKVIKDANPVSINVLNTELEDVLKLTFKGQPFIYNIDDKTIIIKPRPFDAEPQPIPVIKVSGVVTDSKGVTLPGASVRIKGSDKGVITDSEGRFTIEANDKSVLVISFAGFVSKEVTVTGATSYLTVQLLDDTKGINEVVVVGYGKQKKVSITGAVTTVNVADITTPNRSLSNALAGKVAGVISMQRSGEPGYDNASFTIRGIGTFTGNANPLIIIDGVQRDDVNSTYGGAYNNIDPEDIQSISLLKDASSTAVYGAKGANGVLIITTKRGVAGKPKISLKTEATMSGLTKTPKMLDAVSWMRLHNEATSNDGTTAAYSEETIQKTASGLDPYLYPNVNWIKSVYKDWAPGYNTNLNVSGGAPSVRYYVSASFYDQEGSYKVTKQNGYNPNLNFKRYDFRSNLDIDLSKSTLLTMNLDALLVSSRYPGLSAGNIWYESYLTPPNAFPIRYPGGQWAGPFNNGGSNPVNDIQNSGYHNEFRPTVQSVFSINQKLDAITNGLSAMARFSFDSYSENDNRRTGVNDLYLATSRDADGNLVLSQSRYGNQFLGYSQSSSAEKTMYLETNINYDQSFGKHHFGGLFLYNMRSRVQSSAGDVVSSIPYNNQGFAGRATYAYADRYLFEVNAGYTGSENFEAGKKFGFFPSVSGGWVISREPFFKNLTSTFNLLKVRGSHGIVGNDQIGSNYGITRFPYIGQYGAGGSVGLGLNGVVFNGITESVIGVENLTWEKATKDNIGLEIGLFNKLNITIDAYKERRTNILVKRSSLSGILGVSGAVFANLGEMNNRGIEGNVEYNDNFGKVSLRLYGNLTYNNNKIIQQDEPKQLYSYQQSTGRKYGDNLMYIAEGLFTSQEDVDKSPSQFGAVLRPGDIKYKDVNGDGVINSFDRVYTGKSDVPTILYGAGFTVGYHNFDLSLFFQGVSNVVIMANGSAIIGSGATGAGIVPFTGMGTYPSGMLANLENRWTVENPSQNVDYPRLGISNQNSNNYQPSTWWSKDASFVRLKQATLGYTLKPMFITKAGINSVYLYLTGQNLLTFSKFKLWDPELGSNGAGYPPVRLFALGLRASF
ncbi:TonB-linked outer membrane protein, SusC/RagA family [Mucilaginibacter gossypiicola]|uniref:TonB-linked outer membrane protein, SusC/RagA family n=1 Tax=Mucilaginibacter gossypiicola TaxID=551995 RepID=A0A1H8BS11_9SPHI|nr:TonB-dependent receptor [Mucilaginibacter gossypiicola]SEM84924.1 TonB-linked outer membrane protein, SusC/RagA family [Mucilaginibacter gossypiicola]